MTDAGVALEAARRDALGAGESVQEAVRQAIVRKNTVALRLGAALTVTMVPFFWVLDWFVVRDHVVETGVLRAVAGLYGIFVLVAARRWRPWLERNVDFVTLSISLLVAWSIAGMCWWHEGYESSYYAGIGLTVIVVGFLFAWPVRTLLIFNGLLYLFYMAPLFLGIIPIRDPQVFISNQFFLIGTIIITSLGTRHRFGMEVSNIEAAWHLQQAKGSLEEAIQRLKDLDQMKTRFFSNITHELRTPLTMILSPLESILTGELGSFDPQHRTYLAPIWRAALKLLRLINDLLDLARIEEKYLVPKVAAVDLGGLLHAIVDHARPLASRKDIALRIHVPEAAVVVWVDAEKMERVFVNLLSNALKFTEPGGAVDVALEAGPEEVRVRVRDTGVGIPEDKLERVFERFNQVDDSVTRRFGGSGIGLSLAQELVELHGGTIGVQSRVGEGSEFTVCLRSGRDHLPEGAADEDDAAPAAPREWTRQLLDRQDYRFLDIDEATERRVVPRESDARRATKVLVVEDSPDVLRLLHLQLREDHAVYLAQNGRQGLALARRERPDVIVSDFMMPEMDGVTMIRELKKDPATQDIPVVLLTAKNQVEDRLIAREAGADIYLSKPFSPRELRAAVRQLIEKRGRQATVVMKEHVRSLEVISAALAHEINNPLSYLKNALYVIGEHLRDLLRVARDPSVTVEERARIVGKAEPRLERMRAAAENGVARLEQVVDLVRRYAREGFPREPVPLVLDDAVRDVGRLMSPADGKEVQVTVDLAAPGVRVRCLPEEMQQVIRNLWQNALDAVGPGGRVQVRTRVEGEVVVFEVQDDGPGIPREEVTRIFTPFYTTKGPGSGMGIGLAIVLQVVTQSGGVVAVDSNPGEGSTFRVRLPVAARLEADVA